MIRSRTVEVGGKLSVKETVAEVICNDLVGKGRELSAALRPGACLDYSINVIRKVHGIT